MPTVGNSQDGPYVQYDGSVNAGGSRSWRDNNPGNIEAGPFADAHGAIGSDGRFAIFPDAGAGMQALVSLLSSDGYQGLTIEQAMERYAPPSENDTDAYTSFIADNVGVDPSTQMSDLTPGQLSSFANAIQTYEGNTPGTTYQDGDVSAPGWVQELFDNSGSDDPDPAPDPSPSPTPDPVPNPTPDPDPIPVPDPPSDPVPMPLPGPTPEPSPNPPDPEPDPAPDPSPEPAPDPGGDGPEDPGGGGDGGGGGDEGGGGEGGGGGGGGEGGGGGGGGGDGD
jgi:uncharacterized membrane protein YgcG